MGRQAGEDVREAVRGQVTQNPTVQMKPKQGSNTTGFIFKTFRLAVVWRRAIGEMLVGDGQGGPQMARASDECSE